MRIDSLFDQLPRVFSMCVGPAASRRCLGRCGRSRILVHLRKSCNIQIAHVRRREGGRPPCCSASASAIVGLPEAAAARGRWPPAVPRPAPAPPAKHGGALATRRLRVRAGALATSSNSSTPPTAARSILPRGGPLCSPRTLRSISPASTSHATCASVRRLPTATNGNPDARHSFVSIAWQGPRAGHAAERGIEGITGTSEAFPPLADISCDWRSDGSEGWRGRAAFHQKKPVAHASAGLDGEVGAEHPEPPHRRKWRESVPPKALKVTNSWRPMD